MRILLVESDQELLNQLQEKLTANHFLVDVASDSETALGLLHSFIYDLILLEISSPAIKGISLCHHLREIGNPILILLFANANNAQDYIRGLESGADDCLQKPLNWQELLARIHILARRSIRRINSILSWGPVQLDPVTRQVNCNGQLLPISRREFLLLELFLNQPKRRFTRPEIADRLWTLDDILPSDATIRTHIRSIRRKLESAGAKDFIETRYGHGYGLNPIFEVRSTSPNASTSNSDSLVDSITANMWHELMAANARLRQEIEERKQAEIELQRSERLLRNAQRVAKIGAWEFDISRGETYWTEELYPIHGLDPNQSAPTQDENVQLIHPEDLHIHENQIAALARQGKPFEANLRIIRGDGEVRYVNARGGPIFNEKGELIKLTGTTFDITDWMLMRQEKLAD
jgi:PAS domain S-box-containing protein